MSKTIDPWVHSQPYERFMGRWSRKIAPIFLTWLGAPPEMRWLDVGCGTGALSFLIADTNRPAEVWGVDSSEAFIAQASKMASGRAGLEFQVRDASHLDFDEGGFDLAVSALALNFFPDPRQALLGMKQAVRIGGRVALFVWDYAGGMQMLRAFWDAAVALDAGAVQLDEAVRFPVCQPQPLRRLFQNSGFSRIQEQALKVKTIFSGFDDYWEPFLGGTGPAPGYLACLGPAQRGALENHLRSTLPVQPDGSIPLFARAWAIQGTV